MLCLRTEESAIRLRYHTSESPDPLAKGHWLIQVSRVTRPMLPWARQRDGSGQRPEIPEVGLQFIFGHEK